MNENPLTGLAKSDSKEAIAEAAINALSPFMKGTYSGQVDHFRLGQSMPLRIDFTNQVMEYLHNGTAVRVEVHDEFLRFSCDPGFTNGCTEEFSFQQQQPNAELVGVRAAIRDLKSGVLEPNHEGGHYTLQLSNSLRTLDRLDSYTSLLTCAYPYDILIVYTSGNELRCETVTRARHDGRIVDVGQYLNITVDGPLQGSLQRELPDPKPPESPGIYEPRVTGNDFTRLFEDAGFSGTNFQIFMLQSFYGGQYDNAGLFSARYDWLRTIAYIPNEDRTYILERRIETTSTGLRTPEDPRVIELETKPWHRNLQVPQSWDTAVGDFPFYRPCFPRIIEIFPPEYAIDGASYRLTYTVGAIGFTPVAGITVNLADGMILRQTLQSPSLDEQVCPEDKWLGLK